MAEDRDSIGNRQNVFQLVADKDDADPLAREVAENLPELLHLFSRKKRRRLVENEDARVSDQRLDKFDVLLFADGEPFDLGGAIERQAVPLRYFDDPPLDFLARQSAARAVVRTENEIFDDCEGGDQRIVLLDKSEAVDNGFPGISRLKLFAVDKDAAGIGAKQPVENADQRGLPGAVLAEQSVDFAFLQVEGNGVVGKNSRKSLRDAIDLQQFTIRAPFRQTSTQGKDVSSFRESK